MKFFLILALVFTTCSCLRNFRIIQENVNIKVKAPDIIDENASVFIRKLNRTYDALNASITVKVDLDNIYMKVDTFEKRINKYHPFVMDMKLDFCEFMKNPAMSIFLDFFYPLLLKHSNLPRKCPIRAGNYYIHNLHMNEEDFPPSFPVDSHLRFVISLFHHGRLLYVITLGIRVEPKHFWE
ncbi:hypothetical protein DMENIID0001_091650 [Sergentomyia squamirostris]